MKTTRTKRGRPPTTLPPPWDAYAAHVGGVSALAAELELDRMTLHRYAHGLRTPSALARRGLNAWARARRLPAPYPDHD
jgi:hypothetical protein